MGSARNSGREHGDPAGHFDAESALLAFDEYLGQHRHPVAKVDRIHALEIATGIAARAPGGSCTEVSGQLRTILRRHGIFINDLRPR